MPKKPPKPAERKLPIAKLQKTTFPLVTHLPTGIYLGIGSIVQAHAILETQVLELLFELTKVQYPIGRVILRYQAATERFKTVRRLLDLHGITPTMNTKDLLADIQDCCDYRDQFAHGIWMRVTDGGLALRRTRGDYETPDGKADRSFVPEACLIPDGYYEQAREIILRTTKAVMDLKAEIKGTFRGLPEEA